MREEVNKFRVKGYEPLSFLQLRWRVAAGSELRLGFFAAHVILQGRKKHALRLDAAYIFRLQLIMIRAQLFS
jgi:hypothetical protein